MAIVTFNFLDATYKPPQKPVVFNFIGDTFNIIGGRSNNFISIWADERATRTSFKIYVASTGSGASMSVIDLKNKVLLDNYTKVNEGAFGETLDAEDIADISIGSRG